MMDISSSDLQKFFNSSNEKIECHIEVSTETNKKKKALLTC